MTGAGTAASPWVVTFVNTSNRLPRCSPRNNAMQPGGAFFKSNRIAEQDEEETRLKNANDPECAAFPRPSASRCVTREITTRGGAFVENITGLFETAIISGGRSNNTLVVNDNDGVIRVGNVPITVTPYTGALRSITGSTRWTARSVLPDQPHRLVQRADQHRRKRGTSGFDELVINGFERPRR